MRHLAYLSLAVALIACTEQPLTQQDSNAAASARAAKGKPVESRPPNAPDQRPAFEGQTRAPGMITQRPLAVDVITEGLEHPWALEFLPDGRLLVTERPGRLRLVSPGGHVSEPIAGLPAVAASGQGGLLDVALDPDHGTNQLIYWSYSEPRGDANGTSVARGRLVDVAGEPARVEGVEVIFRAMPSWTNNQHFGSRLVFDFEGKLFVTLGDRYDEETRVAAQSLGSHLGKIVRINPDGSVPQDNPFVGIAGAMPEIWSYGHRNVQAAVLSPTDGSLWTVEHGARGGDELNEIMAGANYGWPLVTYGIDYSGEPIGLGITQLEGTVQPIYYWDPVIAPSGATFYEGSMIPEWRGNLLVGGLAGRHLVRLVIEGNRVIGEERLLTDQNRRIRDVEIGPEGAVWVVTDEEDGALLRLRARE